MAGFQEFRNRAKQNGVAWDERNSHYSLRQKDLEEIYSAVVDDAVVYPDYYLNGFHGYSDGNLCWAAAKEVESAQEVLSMALFPELKGRPEEAKQRFLQCICNSYAERVANPSKILDIGCGIGLTSRKLLSTFPEADLTGIDLSPYYISVAKHQQQKSSGSDSRIRFFHMKGEDVSQQFPEDSFDLVVLALVVHECPLEATKELLRSAYKVCKPGGVMAVTDCNPKSEAFLQQPVFIKAIHQVSEPYLLSYFEGDMTELLREAGFQDAQRKIITIRHASWTGIKPFP